MDELYYSPLDIAAIIYGMDAGLKTANETIRIVWDNDKSRIAPIFHNNKRKFILDVYYWLDYFGDKDVIDSEFPAVQNDLLSIGTKIDEEDYIRNLNNLNLFFKNIRIRIITNLSGEYVRVKLRTLLKHYGYKRRSQKLNDHLKKCMDFYGLKAYVRGRENTIDSISPDDMITFRVK